MAPRSLLPIAGVLCAAVLASPALAQSPSVTERPAPGAVPGKCTDRSRPVATFTVRAARRAGRGRILRGTARDIGCGLDRVEVSVSRKRGQWCLSVSRRGRMGRRTRCAKRQWLQATGTTRWSFRLPARLAQGVYIVRTRPVDFAGNVGRVRARRVTLRRVSSLSA